jgi:GNAT superfamily N-acetyltransferase
LSVPDSAPIEFLEAEAWAQRVEALPAQLKERLGTRVRRFGRAVALATPGADAAAINRILGLGFDRPLDDALLAHVNAFYRETGVPRWVVECSPRATIRGGAQTLIAQGGVLRTPTVKLVGEIANITPFSSTGGVSVAEVDPKAADIFRSIVAAAYAMPEMVEQDLVSTLGHSGWHYYVAFDDGQPIAGAAMYVERDAAWFGLAGTSSDARNRGAQTALIARRAADARKLGCSWATAETWPDTADRPNPSYRNMLRAGFTVAYFRDKYVFERASNSPI